MYLGTWSLEHLRHSITRRGFRHSETQRALGQLDTQVLGHLGPCRAVGHSDTQTLGQLGTRGTRCTLFSRPATNLLSVKARFFKCYSDINLLITNFLNLKAPIFQTCCCYQYCYIKKPNSFFFTEERSNQQSSIRHFSHVTKSCIFKNVNLKKKIKRSQLSRHSPEKPFQAPKIIFKSLKHIGQESWSYGHLLKDKILNFTFLREPVFQILVRGSLLPKKI